MQWWHEWRDLKVLPWGGADILEQPAFVHEAIRKCEEVARQVEAQREQEESGRK